MWSVSLGLSFRPDLARQPNQAYLTAYHGQGNIVRCLCIMHLLMLADVSVARQWTFPIVNIIKPMSSQWHVEHRTLSMYKHRPRPLFRHAPEHFFFAPAGSDSCHKVPESSSDGSRSRSPVHPYHCCASHCFLLYDLKKFTSDINASGLKVKVPNGVTSFEWNSRPYKRWYI